MGIFCLHTDQSHVARFERLFNDQGYAGNLGYGVRPDLLAQARAQGSAAVAQEVQDIIADQDGVILCSCSTLGPLVEGHDHVVRIDRPLMEAACDIGGRILVAICLESTREPTLALLQSCAAETGCHLTSDIVLCAQAWPYFEQGNDDEFAAEITRQVDAHIAAHGPVACIVLGQASMQVAQAGLARHGVPVLSSPALAVARAIELALAQ